MPTKSVLKPINRESRSERSPHSGIDLSISIASYNTKAFLRRCLMSIFKYTKQLNFEVIVVDNASSDGSAKMVKKYFPKVKLIVNPINNFYTGANNQALSLSKGKYFLILNSDISLKDNAFKKMVDYLNRQPKVGAIEALQRYEDGRIVITGSQQNSPWLDAIELTLLHKLLHPQSLSDFRLTRLDRAKSWPAPVICDACFMTRTDLLKKNGGYDEKLKLYYTENDLCRKIQKQKLTTIHYSHATVWHRVSASTDKVGWKKISGIFSHDARIYYSKYHSLFAAWVLFLAMKISNLLVLLKQNWQIILIVLLASWLRFYRLPETMTFIGDQGRDYLAAREMVQSGHWPLVGIPSSVPWLRQGPLFIWLIALSFKLGHFNPLAPAVLTAVFGVLTVYLVYRFSHSRLAALVMATSPLALIHSRMPYHVSPIPLFTVLYLIALQSQSVAWTFLLAGVLLQFELTTLPLLLLALIYFYKHKLKIFPQIFLVLIPFIPKLIYDFSHGFTQTFGFGAWTIHRLLEWRFSNQAILTIAEFWQKFVSWDHPLTAVFFGILAIITVFKHRLLFYFLLINLVALYFHGNPSEAYFPVLFPVWAIMIGLVKPKLFKAAIVGLCLFNSYYVVSHNFLTYGPPLAERVLLTKVMLRKVNNQPVRLINYPDVAKFTSYLDNYRYLLWYYGGRESPKGVPMMIYDGPAKDFVPPWWATVYHFPTQKLIKYD
ncbi:MAG: glycosyltransferase [Candidatus Beckwithbacteria bacterium]|nr:glycosyltransferase [Candidatus Beckwithbacteria bacterium]